MKNMVSGLKGNISIGKLIIQIFLAIYAVIQVYPLIWLVLFSLKDNNEIFGGNIAGLPKHFLWQNYANSLLKANAVKYFFNSTLVTAATILFTVILASMTSYAICRMKWRLSNATLITFSLGMMIPIHAALLPLFMVLKLICKGSNYCF